MAIHRDMLCEKGPTIIAMQGDPSTGKTYIAEELAQRLKCLTLCLDDVLEVICPSSKPENADALVSKAFDVITRMVKTHISLGLSIIVDSPLSRRSHLEELLELLRGWKNKNNLAPPRLIIIECKPVKTMYTWERRFEHRRSGIYRDKWYKPHSWPLDPGFSRDYTDDDEPVHPRMSKLVLDTTDRSINSVVATGVVAYLRSYCADQEDQQMIEFDKWWPTFKENMFDRIANAQVTSKKFCRKGHLVSIYKENGIDDVAMMMMICRVCMNPVDQSGGAYTCRKCPLAIHKSCAELETLAIHRQKFPEFTQRQSGKLEYSFPEKHLCFYCEQQGKEFSYECGSCIFECHLKCRLLPTVVKKQAYQHLFYFFAYPISRKFSYTCMACGGKGYHNGYSFDNPCTGFIHSACLFSPHLIEDHVHCGYTHDLELIVQREKELEDYICHLCFQFMNADGWYYCCKICHLELTVSCAFKEFV